MVIGRGDREREGYSRGSETRRLRGEGMQNNSSGKWLNIICSDLADVTLAADNLMGQWLR